MEERGLGYIADILVFAFLVSTAITLLSAMSPVDPRTESERYASSFAQSILMSFQHSTADQLGGFEYELDALGFGLDFPLLGESKRKLDHKTIAQLLAEDAILNVRMETGGRDITLLRPNKAMDDALRALLKSTLDRLMGGRFGYRLRANTKPIDLGFAVLRFEFEIEALHGAKNQLCRETMMLPLPTSREELALLVKNYFGFSPPQGLKTDLVMEVELELWSS